MVLRNLIKPAEKGAIDGKTWSSWCSTGRPSPRRRRSWLWALGRSLKTTNSIESVNALIEERCAKVDRWQNSNQRQRWLATVLLEVEPRLRNIKGYRHLAKLREALQRELKIGKKNSSVKEAA